jgi:tetratricopeptide (TPR) repeat protein
VAIDLSQAIEQHRRGELKQAASTYEAALVEDPDRHEALHLLGMVALQRGDARRGVALIMRALAIRPDAAGYRASLGEAYWALGEPSRAIDSFRESLRLQPDNAETLCNLGSTLKAQGDVDGAINCFQSALKLRPDLAAAHNNLGSALEQEGASGAALEHFRAAVQFDPWAAEAQSNLGLSLLARGEPEEALSPSQEAVRLRPSFITARLNLGNVLQALGRLDDAKECFRAAIGLHPGSAAAHAGLADVLEALGDLEGALESLREATQLNPRHTGALARLATLLRDNLPAGDQAKIEQLLADPNLPPAGRWPVLFGMAQVFDARAEFDRAAALGAEANALQQADFQRRGMAYDSKAHERFVDGLLAAFTPQFFARVRGWGVQADRPVFVVGMPRSGTSLVEQILASHPRVYGAGELQLARNAFKSLPQVTGHGGLPQECLVQLNRDAVALLAHRHLDALADRNSAADRVVDKMPENTLYLGLLTTLFPRAKFVHCRRDLRDIALSCWITNFGQVRWACREDHIAARAGQYRRVMDHWRRVLPVPMLEVDYESIIAGLEPVARELVAWCGVEWDPACLDFHKTLRAVRTASAAHVRRPIYKSSVGRWKNYERPLASLFAKLDQLV